MENRSSSLPLIIMMTVGLVGLIVVQSIFFSPPKKPDAGVQNNRNQGEQPSELANSNEENAGVAENESSQADPEAELPARPKHPRQFLTLGKFAEDAGPLVVTLDSLGAVVRRIELNDRRANGKLKYFDVENQNAYIGQLELQKVDLGCQINLVAKGCPADIAGLQVGDVIKMIEGEPVVDPADFHKRMGSSKPGQELLLVIDRNGTEQKITASSTRLPMQLIRPTAAEKLTKRELKRRAFQLTLKRQDIGAWPDLDETMRSANWQSESKTIDGKPTIEFSFDIANAKGQKFQIIKRYQMANDETRNFHIDMDIEIRNLGTEPQEINYELCGPTGLPGEGWWYQQKIHGSTWAIGRAAGARDITMATEALPFKFVSGPQIVSDYFEYTKDKTKSPGTSLVEKGAADDQRTLRNIGVDTLYFNVALLPKREDFKCYSAFGLTSAKLEESSKKRNRLTDISFVIYSDPVTLAPYDANSPNTAFKESFEIFAGPKDPELLEQYKLDDTRTFGWFAIFSKPLIWLLHLLYKLTFSWSYGVAIVLLTFIVRLCMVPISRKAALNAQMMQYLAPQMKELQEKHKEDPRKFFQARQELCARYNYKPLGGCLLMFVQLPIFLGLYRGLSVDVALRDAPLFPGLNWCTNLGGPDKLFEWQSWMPSFLGGETGFLGPYFNLLPIAAIVLMFIQQKMFMPPATDDQSAIAQKMMKYMMLVFGFIFFKVAAGLCLYFITSSAWSVVERKMLPKPELDTSKFDSSDSDSGSGSGSDSSGKDQKLSDRKALDDRRKRDKDRKRRLRDRD